MKVKKQKNRSPSYKYTKKANTEKLPKLIARKEVLEEKVKVMTQTNNQGLRRVQGVLKRVTEDIADIEGRKEMVISNHFRQRFHDRVDPNATDEQIIQEMENARIPEIHRTLGPGAYPYNEYIIIINEWILTSIIDPSIPKGGES